jgi:putative transposase
MAQTERTRRRDEWKGLLAEDREFLRGIVETAVQDILEAEMTDALQADKHERTTTRVGYRSGYYGRTLLTRVGTLELRVPQDREGRFSTEVFQRYQRSEKALVCTLAELSVQGSRRARSRRSPSSCVATA